jgi:hypothetical protein
MHTSYKGLKRKVVSHFISFGWGWKERSHVIMTKSSEPDARIAILLLTLLLTKTTEVTQNHDQVCSPETSNLFRPIPREEITSVDIMCGKGKKCFNNTGT